MKSKKIIHLISTIERGGAEKQLVILTRGQVEMGLQVEIIYLKGHSELKKDFELVGCFVNSFIANKTFVLQIINLFRYLRKNPCPVHAHLPKSELLASLACPKKTFIFSRHNSEIFWPKSFNIISRFFSKFVCSRAAGGIAISKAVKNYVIDSREITSNFRFDVVYYGFDLYTTINRKALYEFDLMNKKSRKSFNIGAIGRLVEQKNYPILLKAFQKIVVRYPTSRLFIIGEGKNRSMLELIGKDLGINGNLFFLGKTNYIFEFLSLVDLFILPSKYEGFGLVLLEAMTSKKPILAANNSSIPEVLGSEYPGLFKTESFEELFEKIERCIIDKNFSNHLINLYSYQLKNFDPELMIKKINKIYSHANF